MMHEIGYKQRIISDRVEIERFLTQTRTGVISFAQDHQPYAVPVNYVWLDGCVYFHGMGSGRKYDILAKLPDVCFVVYQEFGTVTDPVPCHSDTSYESVMIFGKAQKVSETSEATAALQKLLDKFMPKFYSQPINGGFVEKYRSSMDGNAVAVYRIKPDAITAKGNEISRGRLGQGNN